MTSKLSRWVIAVAGFTTLSALAPVAGAQWRATAIGVAEVDTESTLLLLGGLSASPGGRGLAPIIGVQAYHLGFDAGTDRANVLTVKPYLGLANNYEGGSIYGTLGYAFSNREGTAQPFSASTGDASEGLVVAGGWDHWGTGSPWGRQVLASYNTESEAFWGRGRVTKRISPAGATQRRLGGELAYLAGDGYSGFQPGAIMEFHNGSGRIIGVGAGLKLLDDADNAVYFKVELVMPVRR